MVKQANATVNQQYVSVQYDVYSVSGVGTSAATTTKPTDRIMKTKDWYQAASPYMFKVISDVDVNWNRWYRPLYFNKKDIYFGLDVEVFTEWEVTSGRLSDTRFSSGSINYWEYVNSNFLGDAELAKSLSAQKQTSSNYRIQRLIDYLNKGKKRRKEHGLLKVKQLINPFDSVDASKFLKPLRDMSALYIPRLLHRASTRQRN